MALLAGFAGPTYAALPTGNSAGLDQLGARPGATRLPLTITDKISGSIDVGTGNLMLTLDGFNLPGINGDVPLSLVGNSLPGVPAVAGVPDGFTVNVGGAGSLSSEDGGVRWTAGDGYSALFMPVSGSTTAYTAPAGVKADLVKTSTGYKLTSRTTATVIVFDANGLATSIADRNGNTTTITNAGSVPNQVTATRVKRGHAPRRSRPGPGR